ncbi:unnamed protein product [Enterobius vermicularis]|uniref:AAA_8 domain-containing protein n=1 Tax=Enterobius vermicularis TaxID=51028 RepID=A0A0N4UYI5_ENTVE|nr:unnamed protein product [Enterobius vermicularis]
MEYTVINNEHTVYIIEDYQILQEEFLQTLNAVLACGDFPGLFTQQEFDSLSIRLSDQLSKDSFNGDVHDFFAYKIKRCMHFVLVMDSDHPDFVRRCIENPFVVKECSVVWYSSWNADTLLQIPYLILGKNGLDNDREVTEYFSQLYEQVPQSVALPLKYFSFINNYVKIYILMGVKFANMSVFCGTLLTDSDFKAGIEKLTEAKEAVSKLRLEAAKKSKLLQEKQEEANRALKAISEGMTGAKEQKADIENLKTAAEKENAKIEQQKHLIEEQLREVEPLLNEARKAVGSIKTESLSEIRSLRAPPETVRDILQAVLLFMGILDTSWEAMRKYVQNWFLAKSGVKEEIINFDAHDVKPDARKKVLSLVNSRSASFNLKNAKRASAAAAPLAAWVMANLQYSAILEKILPLEQEKVILTKFVFDLDDSLRNLTKAERKMCKLSEGLKTVDAKVSELKANFEALMKEAAEIKISLDEEQEKICAAGTLIERLSGEFDRWLQQVEELQFRSIQLKQSAIISAAYITFLGFLSDQVRVKTLAVWLETFRLSNFDFLKFMSDDKEQVGYLLSWKNDDAPADLLTMENLAIVFNSAQIPFIIDPSGDIASFLEKHYDGENVEKISALQSDFITRIELAARFGKVLIVDDVETIDPSLCTRCMLSIGNKIIDYNTDFRIFFCTKNGHIALPQYIRSAINEVNFVTTKSGLSSQLLTMAINIEQPDLERRSVRITRIIEENKVKLEEIEYTLLQTLASSKDSLLNNTQLLESLNKSKENAESISTSISESNVLKKEINEVGGTIFYF